MAVPPTSIKVLVLPTDKTKEIGYKTLETVETATKPPRSKPRVLALVIKVAQSLVAPLHLIRHGSETGPQPNISLLPDTRGQYWNDEAWERRCAFGTAKHHIFFTRSKSGLRENAHVENLASGDVFVLKVSDTEDVNGRRYYVDLEPDITEEQLGYLKRLMWRSRLRREFELKSVTGAGSRMQ